MNNNKYSWKFTSEDGTFKLDAPQRNNYLYFPLVNESGMMSSITPNLNGDIKIGQNAFFNLPVSAEDLHNTKSCRNFWVYIKDIGPWSASGSSSKQIADSFTLEEEKVEMEAGLLWHKITRENKKLHIKSEITNFVPVNKDKVELMKVKIENTGSEVLVITPTAAIPIYGRSAANIRDHRHVTGLLNRIYTTKEGIEVRPSMTFDERGHKKNHITYGVYGSEDNGSAPLGFFTELEEFIGEGGNLEWPEAIVKNLKHKNSPNEYSEGFEAMGALRFKDVKIHGGSSKTFIIAIFINEEKDNSIYKKYLSEKAFDEFLDENKSFWKNKLSKIVINSGDENFNLWMKWVELQPELRRICGCSFMPHHDYGKGGRGWRDLWQDLLALLLMEPESVKDQLFENFAGIRMDGTNATIIGSSRGEFIADRNNISRVWSDHGVWPLFTTILYINQSGDLDFLLKEQTYFKDKLIYRAQKIDDNWNCNINKQLQKDDEIYRGTILEHLIIENITAFFNVGNKNNIRLENADWNDGFDMAYDKGETVAFTAFYAGNLMELSKLLSHLKNKKGLNSIILAEELNILLDSSIKEENYESVKFKRDLLSLYYDSCAYKISGKKAKFIIEDVACDLEKKAKWLINNIRSNEWIKGENYSFFNGYYDNEGKRVEGTFNSGVRMTLTGQVFPLMMGVATDSQVKEVISSVDKYLYGEKIGSYRLNTNFNELKLNMGRCFGFAFGHKENGAVFSHMAVMYAFALYRRGFVGEGYKVISSLYNLSSDFEKSRIYPGIPEYINEKGRGMYHYLTGSASWLLYLVLTEIYGVKGKLGDLIIEPKFVKEQFNLCKKISIKTIFAGKNIEIIFINHKLLDYKDYEVSSVIINGNDVLISSRKSVTINRNIISNLNEKHNIIEVNLE